MISGQIRKTISSIFGSGQSDVQSVIQLYIKAGQKPWSKGYQEYKKDYITSQLADPASMKLFANNQALPLGYGYRIDERVIELPWVLSRFAKNDSALLDAGSALNHEYLLDLAIMHSRKIVICTLAPEVVHRRSNISYVYDDLRSSMFRDEYFDDITCISTLEHVGMDNTAIYTNDQRFKENSANSYLSVVKEFKRLLKRGGTAYITVPFGKYKNHGWLQLFDHAMVEQVCQVFGGTSFQVAYYQYFSDGWQISTVDACADCAYYDIHRQPDYDPDYAAAARAVACLELKK